MNSDSDQCLTWPQTRPKVNSYPWKERALSLANEQRDPNFSVSHYKVTNTAIIETYPVYLP